MAGSAASGWGFGFNFYYSAIICMVWFGFCLSIFFFSLLIFWQGHIGLKQELFFKSLRDLSHLCHVTRQKHLLCTAHVVDQQLRTLVYNVF